MRTANLVVSLLGLFAVVAATAMVWRWRRLPLTAVRGDRSGGRAVGGDAVRSLGALVSAGVVSGLLVLGFGGRLVMRLLAATSRDAQGELTEAGERVGAITVDGTVGFVVFVGLGGGIVTVFAFLLVRRWLPRSAGAAGLVAGVILTGTLGVLDPLAPDNVDFAILRPTWLAIAAVVATGMLFACTFGALAARLDRVAAGERWTRWLPCVSLPVALIPPFGLFCVAYVAGRFVARGAVGRLLDRAVPARVGSATVTAGAVLALLVTLAATVRIAAA